MKQIFIKACQDFINSYHGLQGQTDFSQYERIEDFTFGIDEGYFGYVKDEIHIVIQGTDESREWFGNKKSNFNFLKKHKQVENKFGTDKNIKMHEGFFEAYNSGRELILNRCSGYKYIYVIGHSRGAGIGTIAARDIKYQIDNKLKTDQKVILITGGSPRVYNGAGAKEFDKSGILSFRLVYRNDIVTRVPCNVFGYHHVGELIWLGKPFILSPVGLPIDHYPQRYLEGARLVSDVL